MSMWSNLECLSRPDDDFVGDDELDREQDGKRGDARDRIVKAAIEYAQGWDKSTTPYREIESKRSYLRRIVNDYQREFGET